MTGKMKKYLKIAIYTFLTLSILIFISGILVFSHPFFLNAHVSLLVKHSGTDPHEFKFQTYTKEEFALEHLNVSLRPEDDFIDLFESRYGTSNKKDEFLIVTYDIQDPEDNFTYTLYGINKYTDLVYVSTRKVHHVDEKRCEVFQKDMKPPADQGRK
ncbi:hypothetical protein MSHOH_2914 [Methanosarcina horonobensis HB-1 = JCM 15518]|uniref:Uncharacterized protein n=1 Tax=Methanosarcina horonobensis HB-1 = JCM 15518 TaxID=1434110 RepID=A0A0E3SGC7_9EURY|nr:hypothetical protein [Methanosarcina horonobensis]AKB79397.1 hypothetical protein MSHOH_2914 [Methanosarcina horonobensis HB-1 = JCM 15518]